MRDQLGISFTSNGIKAAGFREADSRFQLMSLDTLQYPAEYRETSLFTNEMVPAFSELLGSFFKSHNIDSPDVSFTFESNLAVFKRISIPSALNGADISRQLRWDLQQSLLDDLNKYAILETPAVFSHEKYIEKGVLVIKKSLIAFFSELASHTNINLKNLSVNTLSAELAFNHSYSPVPGGLNLIFKICADHLESIFIIDGKIYDTFYEKWIADGKRSFNELVLEKIIDNRNHILEVLRQNSFKDIEINKLCLYGESYNSELIELIEKNIEQSPEVLNPVTNITVSDELAPLLENYKIPEFVEAIGITLDE